MFKSRFRITLACVSLLTLPTRALLATESNPEDFDFHQSPTKLNGVQQTIEAPSSSCFLETLTDEMLLHIFSFLNQRDIPSVARTSQQWKNLTDDNHLWKGFAQRAHIISHEDRSAGRDYKALIKEHSTFSFIDLGTLNGGGKSYANGISGDGSVIVGCVDDGAAQNQKRAFRWTAEEGMESLGVLNEGTESCASDISFDGFVIVGLAHDGAAQDQSRAFRWTAKEGMKSLGVLNGGTMSGAYSAPKLPVIPIQNCQ